MKRLLFLAHRWSGIVLCLFMGMWFVSGVVMMYVGYPKLTPRERLQALPPLAVPQTGRPWIGMQQALAATGRPGSPLDARLSTVGMTPHYLFSFSRTDHVAVNALTAMRVDGIATQQAVDNARVFSGGAIVQYDDLIMEDAWTHSRALDGHRPLHRVQIGDSAGTLLYVSDKTGEVVRDATRSERAWNWVGAWIHWLYVFRGGALNAWWTDIVIGLSLAGTLVAITGLAVGLLRWRFYGRFKSGARSPYRAMLARWHHVTGLAFGIVAITWVFSGLMSMNPWRVFDTGAPKPDAAVFAGAAFDAALFAMDATTTLEQLTAQGFSTTELVWRIFDGEGMIVAFDSAGQTRLVRVGNGMQIQPMINRARLLQVGSRILPNAQVIEATWLERYDTYYYDRAPHTMLGHLAKRLPVLRLKFDDSAQTWVHLDPYTVAVVDRSDARRRTSRWLFAFLHSFDWLPLLQHRPLWDGILIVLSLGGLTLSITGVVMGWRRLHRKYQPRKTC